MLWVIHFIVLNFFLAICGGLSIRRGNE